MRKAIRKRLSLYMLYAALAIMFWFFDLEILSWIFAAFFILPLIIGGGILIINPIIRKRKFKKELNEVVNKIKDRNWKEELSKCDHKWKLIHWNADHPAGLVKCSSCGKEETRAYK